MQRVWVLNWNNITYDKDLTAWLLASLNAGIVEWFSVSWSGASAEIEPWKALIECTRTNGEKIMVFFENTANVPVDMSGTKKVYIEVDQAKLDDWATNNEDGTEIGVITTDPSAYPSLNFIKLYDVITWTATDDRVFINFKSDVEKRWVLQLKSIVSSKSWDYTFTWNEQQNTLFSTSTTWWIVTYTLDPSLFDLSKWLYEFTFEKITADANTVIIDLWSWNTIDWEQTYTMTAQWETVTIKIETSTFAKVVASSNKPVVFDASSIYFWDWSDWDLVIANGETVTLNWDIYNYNNIDIQAGWILNRTANSPLQIRVKDTITIDWDIDLKWVLSKTSVIASSSNFALSLWVWGVWGLWGYRSWYIWGAWGLNPSNYSVWAGWGGWGSSNTNYRGWAGGTAWIPWGSWGAWGLNDQNWGAWGLSAWGGGWSNNVPAWNGWDAYGNIWTNSSSNANSWGGAWAGWGGWGILFLNWFVVEWSWNIDCSWGNWGNWGNWYGWGGWWGGWGGWAIWIIYWTYTFAWSLSIAWGTWWVKWSNNWWIGWANWGAWTSWESDTKEYSIII